MKEKIPALILIALSILLVWVIVLLSSAIAKREEWLRSHCEVIGKISSSVGVGYAYNAKGGGVATTYIPGKTGYMCDDGKQYWE